MTRRILLVLLAFTAAVLVSAVVPLALDAANHDRTSFIQATAGMVRADAAVAQARLDNQTDFPLAIVISQTEQAGDGILIFEGDPRDGKRIIDKGMPAGNWVQLAIRANQTGELTKKLGQPIAPVTEVVDRGSRRPCRSSCAAISGWWAP